MSGSRPASPTRLVGNTRWATATPRRRGRPSPRSDLASSDHRRARGPHQGRVGASAEDRGELFTTICDLRAAPAGLGLWAVGELARSFDDDAERTVRAIVAATNLPADQRIRPTDLRRIAATSLSFA